ncbi:MAG: hypothetical protein WKF63_06045, partial [Thermomicrobiales bacterium]
MIDGRPRSDAGSPGIRTGARDSIWSRLTVSRLVFAGIGVLAFAAAGFLLVIVLLRLVGGYTPRGLVQVAPGLL